MILYYILLYYIILYYIIYYYIITYVPRRGAIGSKPIFLYKCVALLGLLWGCCGPLGALKDPLGAQEGSPGPLGGAQCPAGGRSILDRSLIDPKVAESVFTGDVEQNVVGWMMCYLYVAIYRYISPYGAIRGRPFSSLTLIHQVVPRLCYLASLALPRATRNSLVTLPQGKGTLSTVRRT